MKTFVAASSSFAFLAALGLTGCSSSANPTDATIQPTVVKSDLARDTAPAVTSTDQTTLASGMTAFAFDLFNKVDSPTTNFTFSPASISIALSMAYAGAAGNTAAQMKSVMHVTQDPATYLGADPTFLVRCRDHAAAFASCGTVGIG